MENTLSQIFKADYNRDAFIKNVVLPIFQDSTKSFEIYSSEGEQEVELTETDKRTAKKVVKFGEFTTADDRKVEMYEVIVEDFRQVKIARVGLGALVKKLIIGNNAVFAVFRYEKVKAKHWRFSYVAYDSVFEKGEVKTTETNPKRYTYVFGDEGETYKTAIFRFEKLNNLLEIKISHIQEAFAVEAMSEEFFDEYRETHYANFVRYLTGEEFQKNGNKLELVSVQKPSPFLASVFNGDKKEARDFCKKLLGQIVFLYFIQKKGWLGSKTGNYKEGDGNKNFLQVLFKLSGQNEVFYPIWLTKLFYDTLNAQRAGDNFELPNGEVVKIPYLNGGLFEKETDKFDLLTFPPELFDELFEFFNHYNFTIYEDSPEEHNIAVDPEMLGHIFENLLEDNKDKGAFYTPKEVVQYMTQESLTSYLSQHFEPNMLDGVARFVKTKSTQGLPDKHLRLINTLLDEVKICDPAIGSGAFPMGLLHEIFALKEKIAFDLGFKVWSPAKVKENIIQNSIYGVDIEKGAVDIARLRFWLSLIVDEESPRPLPNLAYKIVVGNSLVGKFEDQIVQIDWNTDDTRDGFFAQDKIQKITGLLVKISEKQKEFFTAEANQKEGLKKEIRDLKLEIISEQLSLMIETKGYQKQTGKKLTKKETEKLIETEGWKSALESVNKLKKSDKEFEHFDWKLDFPEILNPIIIRDTSSRGFDIVIGNPPYIKEYTKKDAFDGFRDSQYYQGKMDIWYGFASIGIDLLKENGSECFIAQNNWITSSGASLFRNKVLKETEIKNFTDFWNYKVFKSAGIQTMIFLLKKTTPRKSYQLKYSLLENSKIKEHQLPGFFDFEMIQDVNKKYLLTFCPETFYDSMIAFNDPEVTRILDLILENDINYLKENEIAQGIVPNPDVVNSRNIKKIPRVKISENNIKVGDGVFVLPNSHEIAHINSPHVKKLIEPNETGRYLTVNNNSQVLLYVTKQNSELLDLKIRKHLEKFRFIMEDRRENRSGRLEYYHLHWPRKEYFFEAGPKILGIRKCDTPSFTFTEDEIYVMMAFNVIKSERFDLRFLTGLFNSSLVEFWLRYKGKMQGDNFQVDKDPLLEIPIVQPTDIRLFSSLVDYLLYLNNNTNKDIISHTSNTRIASHIEDILDMMIFELYFEDHMKENGLDVLKFVEPKAFSDSMSNGEKANVIENFYEWYQEPKNEVRQRRMLIDTRSKNLLSVIYKSIN